MKQAWAGDLGERQVSMTHRPWRSKAGNITKFSNAAIAVTRSTATTPWSSLVPIYVPQISPMKRSLLDKV